MLSEIAKREHPCSPFSSDCIKELIAMKSMTLFASALFVAFALIDGNCLISELYGSEM